MATISVEKLLEIVEQSRNSFEIPANFDGPEWMTPSGTTIEYLDAKQLVQCLQDIIDSQPQRVFAHLIGETVEQSLRILEARSPYEKGQRPVSEIVVVMEQGYVTRPMADRMRQVRHQPPAFNGDGLFEKSVLTVAVEDGVISAIYAFGNA